MSKSSRSKHRSQPPRDDPRQVSPPGSQRSLNATALRRYSLLATLLVCGVLLRFSYPSHAAVEHFDEGVYASNVWFGPESGGKYPARHLYAPPLIPALIEASIVAEQVVAPPPDGPSNVAVMLPNMVIGCLMLLAVWWVTRNWFGDEAAIGALALATFSETHALYSRTALTEVGLLLSFLAGLYCLQRVAAAARWQPKWIVAAGVSIALGWWSKYNGWMPLLIGAVGIGAQFACVPACRKFGWSRLAQGMVVGAIAFCLWVPYLLSLEGVGGYGSVMANHRTYVVGLSGWAESFSTQWQNLRWFDGWLSCLAPATGMFLLVRWRSMQPDGAERSSTARLAYLPLAGCAASLVAIGCWLGSAAVLACLGLVGLIAVFLRPWPAAAVGGSGDDADPDLGRWMLAAWFLVMFILTPLYSPYPRLVLPWLCSTWIAGGVGMSAIVRQARQTESSGKQGAIWCVLLVAALGATAAKSSYLASRGVTAWQDRSGLKHVAARLGRDLKGNHAVVFVYGEPALFYHLRAAGVAAVPGIDLQSPLQIPPGMSAYLVSGLHATRNSDLQRQLAASGTQLESIYAVAYDPSDLVLLNNFRPWELAVPPAGQAQPAVQHVRLYQFKNR